MTLLEYSLKALAVLVIGWILLLAAFPSLPALTNAMALFLALLSVAMAFLCGTALLATDLLYPKTVSFAGIEGFLLFLALGAALSALFALFTEGLVVRMLNWLGAGGTWAETGFALVHGLVSALLLMFAARLVPGIELATGGALVAGLIGAFSLYLAELDFIHSGSFDTEDLGLLDDEERPDRLNTEAEETD